MKFNFAHLLGSKPGKKAKPAKAETPEEEDDPQTEAEDDDPEAEEEDDPQAEAEDDDPEAEEEEEEEPAAAAPKGKAKARKEAPEVAAARREGFKAGRKFERNRCGSILSHKAAAGRLDLAMSLATNSSMTVEDAVRSLEAAPKTSRLSSLMKDADPSVGAAPASSAKDAKGRLTAAADKMAKTYADRKGRK